MSQKFSFIIIVEPNGNLSSKVFKKENAQDALNEFAKIREQGKEAHFFHFPKPDKRCKSASAMAEVDKFTGAKSQDDTVVEEEKAKPSSKKSGKSSDFKALDLE
jgi:calcineurin-like phosphoesterase family protein